MDVNCLAAHKRNSSGKGTMDRDDWSAVKLMGMAKSQNTTNIPQKISLSGAPFCSVVLLLECYCPSIR